VKERLWEELTSKGLRGCQWEVGPRGDGTGGRGDTGRPWETGKKGMASGDTIVASGRQIIVADEDTCGLVTCVCFNIPPQHTRCLFQGLGRVVDAVGDKGKLWYINQRGYLRSVCVGL